MFNNSSFANKFSRTNDTINPAEFKPDKQKCNHNLPIFTGYKKYLNVIMLWSESRYIDDFRIQQLYYKTNRSDNQLKILLIFSTILLLLFQIFKLTNRL